MCSPMPSAKTNSMTANQIISIPFLSLVILTSCNHPSTEPEADWIKVVTENHVYEPGQIRTDHAGNIFCSYNYASYGLDTHFAIIKLDRYGTVITKQEISDLTVYEFEMSEEGEPILASYENGIVTLSKLTNALGDSPAEFGSFTLPVEVNKIKQPNLRLIVQADGSYLVAGSFLHTKNPSKCLGFLIQFDRDGVVIMGDTIVLSEFPPLAFVTGCAEASDGYVLFGSTQYQNPSYSSYFICKTDFSGNILCMKKDTTSWYFADVDSTAGYYCETSDLIPAPDGETFYGCAYNVRFNIPFQVNPLYTTDDNSARVFQFDACGEIRNSTSIKLDDQNQVMDLIVMPNSDLLVAINPFSLIGVYYSGQQNSFAARLSSALTLKSVQQFQTNYMDYLSSMSVMPDGSIVYESAIQSFGGDGFRLQVTKSDENGNF